jgi:putative methionine-R-sulfoxide reductase with GAF domain
MNQTIGDVTNGIGTVAGDNNINTVNNVIHNNVTINCTPAQKDEIVSPTPIWTPS